MVTSSRRKGTTMSYNEVRPFLGEACHVRMRCIACRDSHVLSGVVQPGKLYGEVALGGHTFSVEDIEQIWRRTPSTPRRRRRWWPALSAPLPLLHGAGRGNL
jgi:hypothetical protein